MTSNLRIGLAVLVVLIARAHVASAAQSQTAGKGTTLNATSANVSDAGRAVKINILRWSTDEERTALLVAPGQNAAEAGPVAVQAAPQQEAEAAAAAETAPLPPLLPSHWPP